MKGQLSLLLSLGSFVLVEVNLSLEVVNQLGMILGQEVFILGQSLLGLLDLSNVEI